MVLSTKLKVHSRQKLAGNDVSAGYPPLSTEFLNVVHVLVAASRRAVGVHRARKHWTPKYQIIEIYDLAANQDISRRDQGENSLCLRFIHHHHDRRRTAAKSHHHDERHCCKVNNIFLLLEQLLLCSFVG